MRLEEGIQLEEIYFADDESVEVGVGGVKELSVVMQLAQMSLVPWFKQVNENGEVRLWNAAAVEGVRLKLEAPHE